MKYAIEYESQINTISNHKKISMCSATPRFLLWRLVETTTDSSYYLFLLLLAFANTQRLLL
jgi:hypothetical protein